MFKSKVKDIINKLVTLRKSNREYEKEDVVDLVVRFLKVILQSFDKDKTNKDIKWLVSKEHLIGKNIEKCPYLTMISNNLE
jgi:hypothetical protein